MPLNVYNNITRFTSFSFFQNYCNERENILHIPHLFPLLRLQWYGNNRARWALAYCVSAKMLIHDVVVKSFVTCANHLFFLHLFRIQHGYILFTRLLAGLLTYSHRCLVTWFLLMYFFHFVQRILLSPSNYIGISERYWWWSWSSRGSRHYASRFNSAIKISGKWAHRTTQLFQNIRHNLLVKISFKSNAQ